MTANKDRLMKPCNLTLLAASMFFLFGYILIYSEKGYSQVSPWKGVEVFQKKGCVQCHSVYGKGGKGGPDLGKNKFYGTYLELATLMWDHFPEMFKKMEKSGFQFQEFNSEEMANLITYISFIKYRGEPGRESLGKKLLKSKGCISCHKFGGKGGDIGPDMSENECVSPLMLAECMWNHGPNMIEIFEENNIKRPEFKGDEMVHLAVAVRAYSPPTNRVPYSSYDLGDPVKGKHLFSEKGCKHCHAIHGVGGTLGPDFSEIDLNYSVTQIAGKMWNHGPEMWKTMKSEGIPLPQFKTGEMANIISYLYSLNLEDLPGDVEEGKKIIDKKGCLSCHSLHERGEGIAPDLATLSEIESPIAMITTMWNHAPAMQDMLLEKKMKWPIYKNGEMNHLYAFLHSLSSPPDSEK